MCWIDLTHMPSWKNCCLFTNCENSTWPLTAVLWAWCFLIERSCMVHMVHQTFCICRMRYMEFLQLQSFVLNKYSLWVPHMPLEWVEVSWVQESGKSLSFSSPQAQSQEVARLGVAREPGAKLKLGSDSAWCGAAVHHLYVEACRLSRLKTLSQIFPTIDSLPASGMTPRISRPDRFFWASPFYVFSFFIILFVWFRAAD